MLVARIDVSATVFHSVTTSAPAGTATPNRTAQASAALHVRIPFTRAP